MLPTKLDLKQHPHSTEFRLHVGEWLFVLNYSPPTHLETFSINFSLCLNLEARGSFVPCADTEPIKLERSGWWMCRTTNNRHWPRAIPLPLVPVRTVYFISSFSTPQNTSPPGHSVRNLLLHWEVKEERQDRQTDGFWTPAEGGLVTEGEGISSTVTLSVCLQKLSLFLHLLYHLFTCISLSICQPEWLK